MAKSKDFKPVSPAEERAAAEAERVRPSRPMSHHGFVKWVRAHEIRLEMAALESKLKQLQGSLYKELDNNGVDVLTRRGIEIFSRDTVKGNLDFDLDGLKRDHPQIYARYFKGHKPSFYRVNWKKFIKF